jgi:tetratricopeptide (TPR) repeat protein
VENLLLESDLSFSEVSSNNVDFLKKVFATTSDSQVMNLIIQLMVDEYQFLAAKQFIETLSDTQRTQLDPLLHLQVLFNSFSLSSTTTFSSLSNVLQNYLQLGKITQDQYWRFSGILAILQRDYSRFFEISRSFSANAYRAFAQKLVNLQEKISQQSDMPAYYFDALVGVELFNQGFFQGAKVLALSVVSQDKAYLLPYQLLAYANFLTASWDAAIEYFHLLSTLNPQSAEKYSFLIGVAYYWNGAYEKSVLQLSQVKGVDYLLDTERYLALNYLALQQTDKLLSTWQKLLGSNGLGYADFFSYFYKVFFEPYSK